MISVVITQEVDVHGEGTNTRSGAACEAGRKGARYSGSRVRFVYACTSAGGREILSAQSTGEPYLGFKRCTLIGTTSEAGPCLDLFWVQRVITILGVDTVPQVICLCVNVCVLFCVICMVVAASVVV